MKTNHSYLHERNNIDVMSVRSGMSLTKNTNFKPSDIHTCGYGYIKRIAVNLMQKRLDPTNYTNYNTVTFPSTNV